MHFLVQRLLDSGRACSTSTTAVDRVYNEETCRVSREGNVSIEATIFIGLTVHFLPNRLKIVSFSCCSNSEDGTLTDSVLDMLAKRSICHAKSPDGKRETSSGNQPCDVMHWKRGPGWGHGNELQSNSGKDERSIELDARSHNDFCCHPIVLFLFVVFCVSISNHKKFEMVSAWP